MDMRDILYHDHVPSEPDPVKRAQIAMARQPLPKRFYQEATIAEEGGRYALKLDGRGAKTPAKNSLSLPTKAAGEIIAAEWAAQVDVINPETMPATKIVNSALDGVAQRMDDVRAEILGFAGSDLVCYRADAPDGLVNEQARHWDPVIAWADKALKASFKPTQGIMHQKQSAESLLKISTHLAEIKEPIALACLHVMTTLSGSCLIALMLTDSALTLQDAWSAATVDEDWNVNLWGSDEEAVKRMGRRRQEFDVAHALYVSVK
jgi:chaperone required for assembly of F1-ATPase